jgi:hypothetical protein
MCSAGNSGSTLRLNLVDLLRSQCPQSDVPEWDAAPNVCAAWNQVYLTRTDVAESKVLLHIFGNATQ